MPKTNTEYKTEFAYYCLICTPDAKNDDVLSDNISDLAQHMSDVHGYTWFYEDAKAKKLVGTQAGYMHLDFEDGYQTIQSAKFAYPDAEPIVLKVRSDGKY